MTPADMAAIEAIIRRVLGEDLDARIEAVARRLQSARPSRAIGEGGEEPPWDDHEHEESGSMDLTGAADDGEFTSSTRQTIEDDARRSIATLLRKQSQRRGSTPVAIKRRAGR